MAFDTLPSIDMRQNSPDIFGDLRSILQSPSGSGWRAFKHFVETIPDPRDFFDNQLYYILSHFERDAWREVVREVPKNWLRNLVAGHEVPYIRLCNTLRIHYKSARDYDMLVHALRDNLWLLDGIRTLIVCGDLSAENLATIHAVSPRFALETLRIIGEEVDDLSLAELLAHPCLDEIRALHVQGCKIGEESAHILAQRVEMNGDLLEHLVLENVGFQPEHFASILGSRAVRHLRTLDLSNARHHDWSSHPVMSTRRNHINDACMRSLAKAEHVSSLESLSLRHAYGITNAGLSYLMSARHLESLRHLDLSFCYGLTDDCVDFLLDNPHLQHLESLDLSHCMLTENGVARLNTSLALPSLKRLRTTATGVVM